MNARLLFCLLVLLGVGARVRADGEDKGGHHAERGDRDQPGVHRGEGEHRLDGDRDHSEGPRREGEGRRLEGDRDRHAERRGDDGERRRDDDRDRHERRWDGDRERRWDGDRDRRERRWGDDGEWGWDGDWGRYRRWDDGRGWRLEGTRDRISPRQRMDDMLWRALRGRSNPEAVLDFLHRNCLPELDELEHLTDEQPDMGAQFARDLVAQATELMELRQTQPDRYQEIMAARQLEQQAHELSKKYRQAEAGGDREQIEKDLLEVLQKAFSARLTQRRRRVEALQKELEQQQADLKKREASRARIIQRRFEELTGEGDKLEW